MQPFDFDASTAVSAESRGNCDKAGAKLPTIVHNAGIAFAVGRGKGGAACCPPARPDYGLAIADQQGKFTRLNRDLSVTAQGDVLLRDGLSSARSWIQSG